MDIKKLQKLVVDALEDTKAQDIKMYDTTKLTSQFDRVCIASGTSNRQTKALAASVRDKIKGNGGRVYSMEGEEVGEWVLVDLGDIVVHIMQPVIRDYYRLEELWGEKEVKIGGAKRSSKQKAVTEDSTEKLTKRTRSNINQATQTTLEDEPKKPARKARTTSATAADPAKPKRASRTKASTLDAPEKKSAPRKKAIGATVKVAAAKRATKRTTKPTTAGRTASKTKS